MAGGGCWFVAAERGNACKNEEQPQQKPELKLMCQKDINADINWP